MGKNPVRGVASCVVVSLCAGCIVGVPPSYGDPDYEDELRAYERDLRDQRNATHVAAVTAAVASVVSVVTLVIVARKRPVVTTVVTERVVDLSTREPTGGSATIPVAAPPVEAVSSGGFGAGAMLSGWALPDAVDAAENCDGGDLSACRNSALMTIHGLNGQVASPAGGCNLLRQLCGFSDSVSSSIAAEQCRAVE